MAELNLTDEALAIVTARVREAVGPNTTVEVKVKGGPPAIKGDTVTVRT